MTIAVYAIAKNEAQHVARWFDSVKDADYITVVDTGSDDDTMKELAKVAKLHKGFTFTQMRFEPFRFDTARNIALSQVPAGADYCMFLDMDETLPEGSFDTIREALESDHDMYRVNLVFSFDEARRPLVQYPREAIHRRWGFYWKHPVHELLAREGDKPYTSADIAANVYHEPDNTKSRSYYFDLLQIAVSEDPDNPRHMQYLGREYMYNGDWFAAIQWLRRHIEKETHGPFRSESARYISECYRNMDGTLEEALEEAEAWLYRAVAEHNSAREPFCDLAHLYFICGAYESAIGAVRSALRIPEVPDVTMIVRSEYYGPFWCAHMLAACYQNLGDNTRARKTIEEMLSGMGEKVTLPQAFMADIIQIFGVDNANQLSTGQAQEGGQEDLPGNEEGRTEGVSDGVPEEQPQVSSGKQRKRKKSKPKAAPTDKE